MALTCLNPPFIYCHIYRTAGNAIRKILPEGIEVGEGHSILRDVKEAILSGVYEEAGIPKDFWSKSFKFAFVRNPFDWQVSLYYYILGHPTNWAYPEIKDKTFPEYLRWFPETLTRKRNFLENCMATQWEFLYDDKGEKLVDYIGKDENINNDIATIQEHLGLPKIAPPLFNIGVNRPQRNFMDYYRETDIRLMKKIFLRDFYSFDYPIPSKRRNSFRRTSR